MLPLYLYYRKHSLTLRPGLELLFQYGAAAALIIPIAKIISFLPARLLHAPVPVESGYYTLAALAAAWLLPHLAALAENVSIKVEFKKHEQAPSDEAK